MKAAVCRSFGPLSNVHLEEVQAPGLLPGTVRLRMAVAAVNPPDGLMPQGKYQVRPELPFVIGLEGAGVVAEVAPDVAEFRVGDRVMTYAGQGCFAEEAVVPAHLAYRIPASMSFEDAAGFAVVYGTAYHALVDRGVLSAGESIAILGAAGGIGLCAIQIAKALGARVLAVASSEQKLQVCREHGADGTVLSDAPDLKDALQRFGGGAGVDMVHDTVGGPLTMLALRGLRPYGRHLIVGYSSGDIPMISGNYVLLKQVSVIGVSFRQCAQQTPAVAKAGMQRLAEMWESGALRPPIARIHPFENFNNAIEALSSRSTIGKHIIRIADL